MNNRSSEWMEKEGKHKLAKVLFVTAILILFGANLLSSITDVLAAPVGPVITFNSTTNATPRPAAAITTAGGTFTTLVLNTTSQTYRWKAYVGNVTGRLILADASNTSIFDWSVTSVTGEVYATRSNTAIDWTSVSCADDALIDAEDLFMNMSLTSPDTINKTFNETIHRAFYVGATRISGSTCRAISTYVNGTRQTPTVNSVFQEILLRDGSSNLIYSTLMNESAFGYNNQRYDFQMILAENEYQPNPTTYYLYVELT
ncbi:MAG: hypothetical protein ACP5NW_04390 [Candidatus Woesearchaeota archaeon]